MRKHPFGECRKGHIPRCLQRYKLDAPLLAAGLLTYMGLRDSPGKKDIATAWEMCYDVRHGKTIEPRRLYPSCFSEGSKSPPDKRKEGDAMYVTYSDLIQIGIFIVALVGLCYTVFKGKKK